MARVAAVLVVCVCWAACGPPPDPERAAVRERLRQSAPLTPDELARLRTEVLEAMTGLTFLKEDAATPELDAEERRVVFGMLTEPAGLFDEGLRERDGAALRVLNAPGLSGNAEIEASRRLWIDPETLLPRRFEFSYAFPGLGDYSFDLVEAQ